MKLTQDVGYCSVPIVTKLVSLRKCHMINTSVTKTGWTVDKSIFYLEIYSIIFLIAFCFGAEAKSRISITVCSIKKTKKKNLCSIKCQKTVCYEYKSNLLCWACTKSIILRENSHFVDKLVECCFSCTNR